MMSRIAIAIPGIAVIVAAVYFGGPVFAAFALIVALAALFEFYGLAGVPRHLQWAGYATAVLAVVLAWAASPPERALLFALAAGLFLAAIAALTLLQFGLGVATVMTGVQLTIAVAHQLGAWALLSAGVWAVYRARGPRVVGDLSASASAPAEA